VSGVRDFPAILVSEIEVQRKDRSQDKPPYWAGLRRVEPVKHSATWIRAAVLAAGLATPAAH